MVWVVPDKAYVHAGRDIRAQSDRGQAIIACGLLERTLDIALASKFPHRDPIIESKLFKGIGPLAPLSNKIDLARLLDILDDPKRKLAHQVREIRNDFAHKPEPITFKTDRIRALCANLGPNPSMRRRARKEVARIPTEDPGFPDVDQLLDEILRGRNSPRHQYFRAVKILLLLLEAVIRRERYERWKSEGSRGLLVQTLHISR